MTAALSKGRAVTGQEGHLERTRLARDLYQIAELVELCFADRLDSSGRSAVREMKVVGRLGPLLWLVGWLDRLLGLGLGMGYVWRAGRHVVGNVSIYRGGKHPRLGRGWLIANVAVHPDFRRRGIARALMAASIDLIRRRGGRWVALQVEAGNSAALRLYDDMGFVRYSPLDHWHTSRVIAPLPPGGLGQWEVRAREPADAQAELDLIFDRARPGAMAWTRTIQRSDVEDFGLLSALLQSGGQDHWLLASTVAPRQVAGALWVQRSTFNKPRLTLFLDPDLHDHAARQALLRFALNLPDLRGRLVRIETRAYDPAVDDLLMQSGFRKVRSLVQMRKVLVA